MNDNQKTEVRVEKRARPIQRRVLVDHRMCGGAGCAKCRQRGAALVAVTSPAVGPIPRDEAAFQAAREHCPCYEGHSINAGVAQCTHAGHRYDGEWCELSSCPRVLQRALHTDLLPTMMFTAAVHTAREDIEAKLATAQPVRHS